MQQRTVVRITRPQTFGDIDRVEFVEQINLDPPAAGPEIELTLGSPWATVIESEVRCQVERATGATVLAIRRDPPFAPFAPPPERELRGPAKWLDPYPYSVTIPFAAATGMAIRFVLAAVFG